MALLNFDASNYDPAPAYDVLPVGEYLSTIVSSAVKSTKAGTGQYLELVFELIEGEFKGRKIWQRINFNNPNPKAEAAAKRELSTLCRALGVLNVQHSELLHNIPVIVQLQIEDGTNGYGPQNRVKTYSAANSISATPATNQEAHSASAGESVPVWKRKGG